LTILLPPGWPRQRAAVAVAAARRRQRRQEAAAEWRVRAPRETGGMRWIGGWVGTALRAVGGCWVGGGYLGTGWRCSVLSVEVKAFTGEWLAPGGAPTQTDARTAVRGLLLQGAPTARARIFPWPASAVGLVRTRTGERGVPPARVPSRAVTSLRPTLPGWGRRGPRPIRPVFYVSSRPAGSPVFAA